METNELFEKVMTTQIGAPGAAPIGGLLTPEQANQFVDYMWDATVLGNDARTVRLRGDSAEIDRIHVGQRLLRQATEAVDDHVNVNATFSKISMTTTKLRLDWELSSEALEDNIEGADLEDHIARLMATQIGNDLEDVAINGDGADGDPLMGAFDGWRKTAMFGGHVVDAAGAGLTTDIFNRAIRALPRRYKQRRNQLRFYSGSNLIQDYLYDMVQNGPEAVATGMIMGNGPALQGDPGRAYPFAFGIPVIEVPLMDETRPGTYTTPDDDDVDTDPEPAVGLHGEVDLTFPKNRLWAVKREIQVYRQFQPKKDTVEYTVFTRVGVAIEDLNAYVVVTNVKVAE